MWRLSRQCAGHDDGEPGEPGRTGCSGTAPAARAEVVVVMALSVRTCKTTAGPSNGSVMLNSRTFGDRVSVKRRPHPNLTHRTTCP